LAMFLTISAKPLSFFFFGSAVVIIVSFPFVFVSFIPA